MHWEQGAAEQMRELQAGTWSPRKRTLEEAEQINREVTAANRATLVPQLREQFSRARTEIVSALQEAPEEMDETFPLARIVRSQCAPQRSPSGATACLGRAFEKWVIVRNEFWHGSFRGEASRTAERPLTLPSRGFEYVVPCAH